MSAAPYLLDGLTGPQIRSLLEACTRSDYVCAAPEIAYLIAHPSHTVETLTFAWDDFRQSTRDASAIHGGDRYWWEFLDYYDDLSAVTAETAAQIKSGRANDAWRLIINGPPWRCDARPQPDPLAAALEDTVSISAIGR